VSPLRAPEQPRCLHAWLAETAGRFPERSAVIDLHRHLTLGALHEQAGALACALASLGVTRGSRVALVMDKSVDAVIAVFGTLSAGGICVPVPPAWPRLRIDAALAACEADVVVAASPTSGEPPTISCRETGVSTDWRTAIAGPRSSMQPADDPGSPALLLFTSGSTGEPKGVTLSHRAIEAFVGWAAATFGILPSDRVLCPSPLGFDLSTLDIFCVAMRGAAAVVMPEALPWMPRLATRFAREAGATIWYSVPSVLAQLLEEGSFEKEPIPSLRAVLFAGEVMPPACAARLRSAYPAAQLWNLYGPTETNVVTAHALGAEIDPHAPVPIGRACPYATLRLDPASVETRDGERVGELLAGGASLMTGYWGRPEETERALVRRQEFGAEVFYRTGDRVVEGDDGSYRFVGRVDRQVKRRGVRIELGEIEAALSTAPLVSEAAAIAIGEGALTIIAAFAAPSAAAELDVGAIRAHCARRLPSYMMPDEIRALTHLPRGSRGKVDYAALRQSWEGSE
jgi:amino acid adenylation domain-containing protein